MEERTDTGTIYTRRHSSYKSPLQIFSKGYVPCLLAYVPVECRQVVQNVRA